MRTFALLLLSVCLSAAEKLVPDRLHGHWVVDTKGVGKDQQEAAAAAAKVENFGVAFTLRTARVVFSADRVISGMWRLDDATPTTATLVIQPRGADERRFRLTLVKDRLIVDECPGKLPLMKSR
jgi:hypothetical protein